MVMADIFNISPQIRSLAENGISTMINQLGKTCTLFMDSLKVRCNNCRFDSVKGVSAGIYNTTGPASFTRPPCPVCRGSGFIQQEQSTTVTLLIDWQPKIYQPVATGFVIPQGLISAKGFIADLPKVIQAKYMILDLAHAKYQTHKFVLWGETTPQGNIVRNKFFTCYWTLSE